MDFVIWALAFELYLSFASMRQSAGPHGLAKTNGKPTKRIVCTLTSESAADGRLTYEKELLNFRKDSHFYKTNHFWLPRVSPPTPMARKNKWQTDETNRGTLTTECAGGNRPTYEKELLNSRKDSRFYKTNHPSFPHTLPPMTQITTFLPYMPAMTKGSCSQIHRFPPGIAKCHLSI
jgi:hypothetical protein